MKNIIFDKYLSFESTSELIDYAQLPCKSYIRASRDISMQWNGGVSFEKAIEMANFGWYDILDKIDKYKVDINEILPSKAIIRKNIDEVFGHQVNIGAFMANQPDCFNFIEEHTIEAPCKIIKIVVSCAFSSSVDSDVILQRGMLICELIDTIEAMGYRVEIVCNFTSQTSRNYIDAKIEIDVVVKKENEPLDMGKIFYFIAHASFSRRILFSILEIEGFSDIDPQYGYPTKATNQGDLYIEQVLHHQLSKEESIKWIKESIKKLGIIIEPEINISTQ